VLEQADIDVDVTRLVPDLARHVHGELPWGIGKIVDGAPGAFHGLQLADHDAVHSLLDGFPTAEAGERGGARLDFDLGPPARPHADEPVLASQLVVGDWTVHDAPRTTE